MPRNKQSFKREERFRFDRSIKIVPVARDTSDTRSAPNHVFNQLAIESKNYSEDDEMWMIIDRDKWVLTPIIDSCCAKGFHIAISSPCIELWFLLHLVDVIALERDVKDNIASNAKVSANKTFTDKLLETYLEGYNKSNPKSERFIQFVNLATDRARHLDQTLRENYPKTIGSTIYKLIEKLKPETVQFSNY